MDELHWTTQRRIAILEACPISRQLEAVTDFLNGKPEKLHALNAEIAVIKAAIPKDAE